MVTKVTGLIRGGFSSDYVVKLLPGTKLSLRKPNTKAGFEAKVAGNELFLPVRIACKHNPKFDGLEGW